MKELKMLYKIYLLTIGSNGIQFLCINAILLGCNSEFKQYLADNYPENARFGVDIFLEFGYPVFYTEIDRLNWLKSEMNKLKREVPVYQRVILLGYKLIWRIQVLSV